jgi:tetratricopeptide (TPR) repeat protein
VANTLIRLGITLVHQGLWPDAEQMYRRAVEILRTQPPSSDLAAALNDLGKLMYVQGQSQEAEDRIREGISIWERVGATNDPGLAAGLLNLGILLQSRKQYDEAERALNRGRRIDEQALPPDQQRIAMDLNAAGVLATARKNYREAEDLLVRAVAILEHTLPPQHPETGEVLLNLAEAYRLQKKLDQARDDFRLGLAAVTPAWGQDDTRLPTWLEKLAAVLRAQEDFAAAEALEIRATRIRVKIALR